MKTFSFQITLGELRYALLLATGWLLAGVFAAQVIADHI